MSRAWIVVACGVLAASATLWSMCARSPDVLEAPAGTSVGAQDGAEEMAAGPEAAPARNAIPEARADAAGDATAEAKSSAERVELRGTFVVVDRDGIAHAQENGQCDLMLWERDAGTLRHVAVTEGVWRVTAPRPDEVSTWGARLGDRVVLASRDPVPVPKGEIPADFAIAFHGSWLADLTLRVRDPSGRDLDGVELWVEDVLRFEMSGGKQPLQRVVVRGASSPLHFMPDLAVPAADYWVHAPGCGWGAIRLAHDDPAPRDVTLPPSGGLEVRCAGAAVPEGCVLRLRAPNGDPAHAGAPWTASVGATREIEIRDAPLRLEDVAIGSYSVQIEKGAAHDWPLVVARAPAEIVAGQVTQVTLVVEESVRGPEVVPVAGTLHLPAAWPREGVELQLQPEKDLAPWVRARTVVALASMEATGPEEYRWSAGKLHAGGYTIAVAPCGTAVRVRVSDAGAEDIRIEAAPPTEVVLRFFDAASGEQVRPEFAQWMALRDGAGVPGAEIEGDAKSAYRFRAPIGGILVFADGEPFGAAMQEMVVAPGGCELRFVGERPYGVDVSVVEGEQPLPWDDEWRIDVTAVDGGSGVRRFTTGSRAAVTAPGRYRVSLGGVKGGTSEETVTVERGAWTRVVLRVR